ncbi:MAG TPA: hypothetical protein H9867_06810 [Candidatus Corynebacterium gallistercoris]|uniref:Uncharacterized protein n=1 Tax=Candidatus Corynebacterium gallistercoris TaxID=2838530 RepID=A0A9D1RYW9_9CORY|nr:hypothetical protein [Candidatus Corynebacterium gallistercoris]
MGLFSTLRKRRQEKKAMEKAAKVRAKAQVKADAQLEKRKEAYLQKTAKQVRKMDAKEMKARRKHEQKMAQSALEQLKAGRFNSKNVARYAGAARVAAPIAIPLAYRLLTQLRGASEATTANRAGVSTASLAKYGGEGSGAAAYRARIDAVRDSLDKGIPSGFAKDIDERMDDLETAVENTSSMSEGQAHRVLSSVGKELDLVEAQIAAKRS